MATAAILTWLAGMLGVVIAAPALLAWSSAERLLALKFLIHFVGDLHQPLHAADHDDKGGNCVSLLPSEAVHQKNLHAYWDVGSVEALGGSAAEIAGKLDAGVTAADVKRMAAGSPRSWAMESFDLGKRDAYALSIRPTCGGGAESVALSAAYQAQAQKDAAAQLLKAGVRMASLLNRALGS